MDDNTKIILGIGAVAALGLLLYSYSTPAAPKPVVKVVTTTPVQSALNQAAGDIAEATTAATVISSLFQSDPSSESTISGVHQRRRH